MKVIIAGSRTISDLELVSQAITESCFDITEVVCGGAKGVDECGRLWAEKHNIPVKVFNADWNKYGKIAGPVRNFEMAKYADALVLVWDGKSPGSLSMKNVAKKCDLYSYEHKVST